MKKAKINGEKSLKERIAEKGMADFEKAIDAMNSGKKRGRKPKEKTSAATGFVEVKNEDFVPNFWTHPGKINEPEESKSSKTLKVIEDEVGGKENLIRIAVRYLYANIVDHVEVKNA